MGTDGRPKMNETKIRIGFVPTYRWTLTPWCRKMRENRLAVLEARLDQGVAA